MPCEQKQTQNPKKIMFKEFLCLKTKPNTEMSNEEHSDSEFYYPEEQETERKATIIDKISWNIEEQVLTYTQTK